MILFLYGDDTFRSREKLNQIKKKFKEKDKQGLNLLIFREEVDFEEFKKATQGIPFLGSARLVIVENVFQNKKDTLFRIMKFLEEYSLPDSNLLVFWQRGEPDKRSRFFKFLNKVSQKEEFTKLSGYALKAWVKDRVLKKGGSLGGQALEELILRVGNDLFAIDNEIDKLLALRLKKEIRLSDIKTLVESRLETDIFKLVDALSRKDRAQALKFVQEQIESGAAELYIFAMIVYAFRNLIIVKDLKEKGFTQKLIRQKTKLHPFVVQKTAGCLSKFNLQDLTKIYHKLLDLDIKIKTGAVTPDFGLSMLIFGITE